MKGPTPCCATCEHWSNVEPAVATGVRRPQGADEALGICRRFPPTIVEHRSGAFSSRFPEVFGARICGDWTPVFEPEGGDDPDDGERVVDFATARGRRAAA